ncbi:MAG: PDZ domain-containing protein [Streptosporangiales bacterium]|nr:PDZ domain-containing protein [Streptosporangiales bacterium]
MSRRAVTLLLAGLLVVGLGVMSVLLPVPYVILQPGPTTDMLASGKEEAPITIKGHRVYPTKGELHMVTVAYLGGPGQRLDMFSALRSWMNPEDAVVPREAIFPPEQSDQQTEQQIDQQMTDSQDTATAAALTELEVDYAHIVGVAAVTKGKPADGRLQPGDVITAVDGTKVTTSSGAAERIRDHRPGSQVEVTVERKGQTRDVAMTTVESPDEPGTSIVGVTVQQRYEFPFDVSYAVGEIGGPSAGLVFALSVIDKLTPGSLTGGKNIAVTGTIDPSGKVGPIGGVQQKVVGAAHDGAKVFFAPAANCRDAAAAAPEGLRVVKIETLDAAMKALDALRTGKGAVPSCD